MWGRRWVGVVAGLALCASYELAVAERPLDKPAFTATPAELLALAKAAPAGDDAITVLRDQRDVSFDDQGRATARWRRIYVVHTQDDLEEESAIYEEWHPSYQDRPAVRARVIAPTGQVTELDPSLVVDSPFGRPTAANTDRRIVQAALPGLQIGAVVEQEITIIDRAPLSPVGSVDTTMLGGWGGSSNVVISYSAPAKKLRVVERKLPAGTRKRHGVAKGRETWTYEIATIPPRTGYDLGAPRDLAVPHIGASTAASWEAVARGHRKQIDQRIAEGAFALPAELPRTPSIETVQAIVGWVHRQVRYTGVHLGNGPLIPSTPADTVKRGTGNGNDKATLLVALLRQAAIRADLVLLDADLTTTTAELGREPDPDLPGMGVFDHALVRARLGSRDVWIDVTEPLARPDQLPDHAQGRRALVIADDAKALSTTPASAPADNLLREVRTFVASENGPAQLTQVIGHRGVFELERRGQVHSARPEALKSMFGASVESTFVGTLDRVTSSDPADLAKPFEMTVTVKDAHRVYTDREQIDIYLLVGDALARVPWGLRAELEDETPRTSDFVWSTPHVYEIENRIVVPTGFQLPSPEPEQVRRLGTATLIERRSVEGQTLIVAFRFETGKVRLTAAEAKALRAAIDELQEEVVHLKIEHTAFALGHAGKHREAIAECKRLIALHPGEPTHHGQLSTILVRAGAGQAARREARKAVALAPRAADPLVVLGWTLTHDTLGRRFTHDWDRAGAIAALQQARKLDPTHRGAAAELALVLQRDAEGRLYEEGADLRGAAEAWRAALAIEKSDEHTLELVQVLLASGQFAEAEKVARTAAVSDERDRWIVAAVGGRAGGAAAIKAAGDLRSGASRIELITMAGSALMMMRQYEVARALYAEAGVLARMPPMVADMMKKVTRQPSPRPATGDPRAAVLDVFIALSDPHHKTQAFWDAALRREFRSVPAGFVPASMRGPGMGRLFVDMLHAIATIKVEGDGGLWRATVEAGAAQYHLYLALDRGVVKLVGATDALSGVGRYLLRASDASAESRARKLLDWIHADSAKATAQATLSFRKLWGPGLPSSRDAILLAAAILGGRSEPERAIAIGSRCSSTLPDAQLACHEILLDAFTARGRWREAVEQIEAILRLKPDRATAMLEDRAWALASAGRLDDAERLLDDVLARDPDDDAALDARFWVATKRSVPEALQRVDSVVKHPKATRQMLNNVAWYLLSVNRDLAAARELARKAVDRNQPAASVVNTLAAIEAELGEIDQAIKNNWKAMELHGSIEPLASDWYVAGRIAEQLDLRADAEALYKRIPRPAVGTSSTYDLAQKRLAALRTAL